MLEFEIEADALGSMGAYTAISHLHMSGVNGIGCECLGRLERSVQHQVAIAAGQTSICIHMYLYETGNLAEKSLETGLDIRLNGGLLLLRII